MATEENKAAIQRLTDAFNERDRETFDTCYAERIVVHGADQDWTPTHDEHWEQVLGIFEAFPDLQATTQAMIAEGDEVFVRWIYAGTHQGAVRGVAPTGRRVEWQAWSHYRLEDGRVVEAWQLSDILHLYDALGIVEVPPRTSA